ncbi:MAG: transglycosylase SLT domain-containing protein [Xanthobacteraceae bacterium]
MLVDSSNSTAGSAVAGVIRQAAQATGTSFHYLLATAQVESGLNPQAGASTSSARGLFQFVEQTWLGMLKQAGPALGYGQYAAAITKNASGHYEVADPAMKSEILKLRNDPAANAVMAGAFTQANAALLADRLGRSPSEGELYIAHFLGAGGAARLISAAADDPNASAASYFPNAAQANTPIFYDRSTGAPRSLAQVRDVLTARYDVAARVVPDVGSSVAQAATAPAANSTLPPIPPLPIPSVPSAGAATRAAATLAAAVPDTAGMTSAFAAAIPKMAAADSQVFHGLFSDPDRTGPVASVVSQLWGVPGSGGSGPPPSGSALLNLFSDDGSRGT